MKYIYVYSIYVCAYIYIYTINIYIYSICIYYATRNGWVMLKRPKWKFPTALKIWPIVTLQLPRLTFMTNKVWQRLSRWSRRKYGDALIIYVRVIPLYMAIPSRKKGNLCCSCTCFGCTVKVLPSRCTWKQDRTQLHCSEQCSGIKWTATRGI